VLETVRDFANLELKAKLELRFGEESLLQNYYTQLRAVSSDMGRKWPRLALNWRDFHVSRTPNARMRRVIKSLTLNSSPQFWITSFVGLFRP